MLKGECLLRMRNTFRMKAEGGLGREEECLETLARVRNMPAEDPAIQYEFRALQAERLVEREAAKERYGVDTVNFRVGLLEYKRLLTTKPLLHRLMLGASAQALQQWTGINVSLVQWNASH